MSTDVLLYLWSICFKFSNTTVVEQVGAGAGAEARWGRGWGRAGAGAGGGRSFSFLRRLYISSAISVHQGHVGIVACLEGNNSAFIS